MLIIVIIINILRFLMPDIDDYSNKARGVTLTLDKALWPSRVAAAAAARFERQRETEIESKNFLFNALLLFFFFNRASVKEIHKILIYHTYSPCVCMRVCVCKQKKSHNKRFVASHTNCIAAAHQQQQR